MTLKASKVRFLGRTGFQCAEGPKRVVKNVCEPLHRGYEGSRCKKSLTFPKFFFPLYFFVTFGNHERLMRPGNYQGYLPFAFLTNVPLTRVLNAGSRVLKYKRSKLGGTEFFQNVMPYSIVSVAAGGRASGFSSKAR